jgi:hypothetical protein
MSSRSYPVIFPELGPDDTAEEKDALIDDFKDSCYIWYSGRWHSSFKDVLFWPPHAESASTLREKLDKKMAEAIPMLRAQLREAEAAAARLHAASTRYDTGK